MSMVSLSSLSSFSKYILFWHTFFFVGSVAQEPTLFSDFGLACYLGLHEEVKKACLHITFLACECGFT